MKILYFSWLREKVGYKEHIIVKPADVITVFDLINFLKNFSDNHKVVLDDMNIVRVAVNQSFSNLDTKLHENDEVAFFPPVTGG